jgi:hypothetical protein
VEAGGLSLRPTWAKLVTPYLKKKIQTKKAGDVTHVAQPFAQQAQVPKFHPQY